MDSLKKQIITALISTVFAFCLFLLTTAITSKRGDDESIIKKVELLDKEKANRKEVVDAKKEAMEYTDKQVREMKVDMNEGFENVDEKLDLILRMLDK